MRSIFMPLIFGSIILTACSDTPNYQKLEGQTMGTSYHITFELPKNVDKSAISASIDDRLDDIIHSMSTYEKDSTISKFNQLRAGDSIQIDDDFSRVLADSRTIFAQSGGVFDPTVYPLVELWGFGSKMNVERLQSPPSESEINAAKDKIGLDKVILNGNTLTKTTDGVGLDFSAIAKGYGVDAIADVLRSKYHITNYMVEIGGEVATHGHNAKNQPWTLAIDSPIEGSTVQDRNVIATITQNGDGLNIATSGNYRNSIEFDGVRYSHSINPHTSHPVADGAPSVTVVHDSVALADGWATALTATSFQQALAIANSNNIKALFIIKNKDKDKFELVKSDAYQATFK
ncbi:FAD:protein FMN transferase [Moraxella nasovis]|uniref:FAD:protein FMN transferase n=1 Tax=Moraxella nasovis TaxID=2904121 RepID=UPI001F617252|nr:FAD:protein FMN transferase [Moraxella nasovis]UNU73816.1 FAD:protein FMN transferase [Moraxella nasovis]